MARTIAKDHDAKRDRILATAARVFAETGFDRASMSQLARECGISKANIYHYYDSKDALLYDILDSYLSDLRDRIAAIDGTGMTPEDHLRAVVLEVLMAYRGADDEHRVQIGGMAALPSEQQKVLRDYQKDLVAQVATIVQALAPDVFGSDKAKLRAATMSLFGMLNWFYMWNHDDSDAAREAYAALVSNLMLKGVRGL
ncbi:TetR family transcriptional regulator [Maritimibacter sp. 55A14]|uniref:TetR/AcrR family transcriptional regulator n=1 Tax=Maritimibacter sp. 55A14 TaxID=2174844 RepID=UPI000D6108E3|nr:TetR/AcrR family transcriptional regulator [Maritimibacter sp. 55A14]PWE32826.1 TetR family transcriptional regulator [Maritimibacter sp. 55A14]